METIISWIITVPKGTILLIAYFVAVWISHEDNFTIDGIKVDINPITELKIGMLLAKNS